MIVLLNLNYLFFYVYDYAQLSNLQNNLPERLQN